MDTLKFNLNDQILDLASGCSALEAFKLAKVPFKGPQKPLAARLNGHLLDLSAPLTEAGDLTPVDQADSEALALLRHSVAHLMAEAVQATFPQVKMAIGPAIENGFYYDFDKPTPFTPDDLTSLEDKMQVIAKKAAPFERTEMTPLAAVEFFKARGENYKVEMIEDLVRTSRPKTISIYKSGDFIDLCQGPHLPDTSWAVAFKLLSVAGAYWRGDERRPMLQRIYGTAFFNKKDLEQHLHLLEEAKRRDHRRLGKELNLFSISDEAGGGLVIWHPRGALLRFTLEEFERREHLRRGYDPVIGPQILRSDLWKKSGHWDNYHDNMYFTEIDGQGYAIKPMNCLAHILVYRSQTRSFRDLPLRFFELGTVHRHEKSGVLHGLTRVRQFTQDDAHLFCTPENLNAEIKGVLDLVSDFMETFSFKYEINLSTRPTKSIGSDEAWKLATDALKKALTEQNRPYEINKGDGAFYGPKIDIKLKDALNRRWQCGTIQCDFTLPDRFDLTYMDRNGLKKRPIMLHRTIFGSLERFIGILTEHFAGAFPTWLAPEQIRLLTVTSRADDFAAELQAEFRRKGLRAEADNRNEKLGYKIREAQIQKIPFMLILGDKEVENKTVAVRHRSGEDSGVMSVTNFLTLATREAEWPQWNRQT
ncbi:MAG: threonine--tRNA ligase [Candidatus Adiutrix intracellularis]|jgi:threonyl-tRNA synthetase|nr:MAG: threonine--tRNA ligase [Candidatus Adiutrix intracellularis]